MILAGGGSRRFGYRKSDALLAGRPLVTHVLSALAAQTSGEIALNLRGDAESDQSEYPVIADRLPGGLGPLAGIHAAMVWAQKLGYETVVTVPVDTPFLPMDLLVGLIGGGAPSVAVSAGRQHGVCGLWPVSQAAALAVRLRAGEYRVQTWVNTIAANLVLFPKTGSLDPFFNINTKQDLAIAEAVFD